MEKFSNEYFHKLANDLKFDLSDEEINELKKDFIEVEKQVELFEKIDTTGVEPMVYPFEEATTFLREDIEEIIDKVVEEYMVEKEYREFVKLLKYFVDIQESKIEKINIYIHKGGGYELKDGYGNDIFNEFMKELAIYVGNR